MTMIVCLRGLVDPQIRFHIGKIGREVVKDKGYGTDMKLYAI